jgi:hypothetical protein
MQLVSESSPVRPVSAVIESLEKRAYLSAAVLSTCPDASATAPAHPSIAASLSHSKSLSTGKIVPGKVTPVDLIPHLTGIVKRGNNGKYIVVQVIVNNAGPVTAKGTLRVTVGFSYYLSGAYPFAFRTINTPIKIALGKTKTVRIAGTVPKSYRAFEYDMVVTLNSNKKIPETNYANDVVNAAYFYLP